MASLYRKDAMRTLFLLPALVLSAAEPPTPVMRVIATPLSAMPSGHDASKPEGTYAALLRAYGNGIADITPLFHSKLHARLPKTGLKPKPEPERSEILGGRIEEVYQLGDLAAIIGITGPVEKEGVDLWFLECEGGRWVLLGNDTFSSLEKARAKALKSLLSFSKMAKAPAVKPVSNPEAHLATFTKYLGAAGSDPKAFLLESLERHQLVAFGEVHNRVASWDLLIRLVQDPTFAERTGTIYLELPSHAQPLMDRFLASETLDLEPVRDILRSIFHSGWPCKDEVDFMAALWAVNRKLEPARRLRVVLVDQSWDWSGVKTKDDLVKLKSDRDALMAERIQADLKTLPDKRHALFQVGYLHLPSNLKEKGGGASYPSAGQRLRAVLGSQFFTVIQHSPIMGNRGGQLDGRVRRGLFDEAFAKVGNKPVAFVLAGSPFGKEPFDMAMDLRGFEGSYEGVFDGYIFLGPLDQDRYSQVAPGFYTDAYALEVERRCQLQFGSGVKAAEDLSGSDGKALEAGMARWMGKPAVWVDKLGPVDAWRK